MASPTSSSDPLFLRAMLESSPDHIYFKDKESRFFLVPKLHLGTQLPAKLHFAIAPT